MFLSQWLKTTVVSKPRQVCTPRWTLERSQHFPTRWELNYQFASCLERYHTTPAGLAWALQINSRTVDLNHKAQVPHILKSLKSSVEWYFYFRRTHFSHTIQFGASIKHVSDRIWRNGSWGAFWGLQHYRWSWITHLCLHPGGNKTVTAAITFLCNVHNLCQCVSPPGESNNMDVMKYEGTCLWTLNDQDSSTVVGNRIIRWEMCGREEHTVWWSGLLKVCFFYPRAITRSTIWPTNHPLTWSLMDNCSAQAQLLTLQTRCSTSEETETERWESEEVLRVGNGLEKKLERQARLVSF